MPHPIDPRFDDENDAAPPRPWDPDRWPVTTGLAHWMWTIPDGCVHYSREWQRMLQSGDDAVLGPGNARWWPRVHEDDLWPFNEAARVVAAGETDQYQSLFRIRRDDGAWIWMLSRGCVTERKNGAAVRVDGCVMDITALRADMKFRHGSPVMNQEGTLPVSAPDLVLRLKNRQATLDHVPGLLPEHRDFLRANAARVFESGLPVRERVTFPTAYGHDVTGEYAFSPEYGEDGRLTAVMTRFRDLTEQLHVERRARLNETRLEALHQLTYMDDAPREAVLDFVMDSLVRMTRSESGLLYFPGDDDDGGRLVWSKDLQERVGPDALPRADLPADLRDMIVRNRAMGVMIDRHHTADMRCLANGYGLFPIHTTLNGALPVMRFISAPVFDGDRLVCMAAAFNKAALYYEDDIQQLEAFLRNAWLILRRQSFIRKLRTAKEAAEQANRVKDAFLANVSHELRTPLNGILGMLQALAETPLSAEQREFIGTADASGRALLRIVSDLLDVSRMEAGKDELHPEAMDLAETVRSTARLFQQEAARKGLAFSVALDDALPPRIVADEARVRQILFNLIGNALKFTERGGVDVTCAARPVDGGQTVGIRFAVRDTGIGIPPDQREAVFDAFTQLQQAAPKIHPGTGLGLTIVKRLVDRMGGSIVLDGAVGVGTTVQCDFRFAVAPADDARSVPDAHGAPPPPSRAAALDILIVEDDAVSAFTLKTFVQLSGHRPVVVDDGEQALEALQCHRFHAVFTDILMPGLDGLELVRRIRARDGAGHPPTEATMARVRAAFPEADGTAVAIDPEAIVVSVSAHAMDGDHQRFVREGMDDCIAKPVMLPALRAVLARIAAHARRAAD